MKVLSYKKTQISTAGFLVDAYDDAIVAAIEECWRRLSSRAGDSGARLLMRGRGLIMITRLICFNL
jgi:hypothetical protein